jgi:hypothetical protein
VDGEWVELAVNEVDVLPTVADLLGYRITAAYERREKKTAASR